MSYMLREYNPNDPQDAEKLAAMWNASDAGWPGGWTQGVPQTGEHIREEKERSRRLAICVVEHEGEIVGFCDLQAQAGQKDVAYIPLLNARPDHHGKGVGKRLVLEMVRRTTEAGYKQVTLGTWAGNLKAVPLYKKTGFFWVPETSGHMANFIPTILNMPIAKDFFAKHDWYRCFKRDLSVQPDDVPWNGIKVFPYVFEEDGDRIEITVDKQSEGITAVETNTFSAACIVGLEDVPADLPHTVRWELVNKAGDQEALQVALMAEGEKGVALSVQESAVVQDRLVIERTFSVDRDFEPQAWGEPAHKIRSTLLIGGQLLTLETAAHAVQPVDVEFGGQSLLPGRREKITVRLRSRVDFPVEGTLSIGPHHKLDFDRLSAPFELEAGSWCGLTFWVTAQEAGVFRTEMVAQGNEQGEGERSFRTKAKRIPFKGIPLGTTLADVDREEKNASLENEALRVGVQLRGGWMNVHDKVSDRTLASQQISEIGPPFVEWRERPPTYEAAVADRDGRKSMTIHAPSDTFPGLTVEKSVTLCGTVVRIDHRVVNTSDTTQKFKLRVNTRPSVRGTLTVPTKEGVLSEPIRGWGVFPVGPDDLSKKPEDYAETWMATEDKGVVCGLLWHACEENEEGGLQFDLPEIPPHAFVEIEPIYLVGGHGDWKTVRRWWQRLIQPSGVREKRKPEAKRLLELSFAEPPLLVTAEQTATSFNVHNRRGKKLSGTCRLVGDQYRVTPETFEVKDICREKPFSADEEVIVPNPRPSVLKGQWTLETELTTESFDAPVVVAGDTTREVQQIQQEGVLQLDNEFFTLKVAPHLFGSLYAIEKDGVNHLKTPYPEPQPFMWLNPWFGGVHPFIGWMGESRFAKEAFTGRFITRTGTRGLEWTGVQVVCDVQQKDNRWLHLEAEYLTLPGSNLVAVVVRGINTTSASMNTRLGAAIWTQPGGSEEHVVLHYQQDKAHKHRRRGEYDADLQSGKWAAVENPDTGDTLVFVATDQDGEIEVWDSGKNGAHFSSNAPFNLEGDETKEVIHYLVLTNGIEQARAYKVLKSVWQLP